jgi:cytochrome c7-like protein
MTRGLWAALLAVSVHAEPSGVEADSRTLFLTYPVQRIDPATRRTDAEIADSILQMERVEAWGLGTGPMGGRLSLHQSGWLLGDAGVETRERPVTGNLRTLYVQYDGPVEMRLGRQYVVGGATRIAAIDGGSVRWLGPAGLDVSAHGGYRALPRLVESPTYARLGDRRDDYIQPGTLMEARTARGFALVGGRIGETVPGWGRGGVSFVDEIEAGQLARRDLGADLALERAKWPRLEGGVLWDVAATDLAEARVFCDVGPYARITVSPSYRREDPTLLISKTSIFSVFESTAYQEAGGEVAWRGPRLTLEAGGFGLFYPEDQTGTRLRGAATARTGTKRPISARVGYERLASEQRGYHGGSASVAVEGLGPARATAEVWAFLFDEEHDGVDYSVTPQASLGVSRWGVDLDGSVGWHTGPELSSGTFGMVKAAVPLGNADGSFGLAPERTRARPPDEGDRLKFSHKQHLDVGVGCEDCHGDVAKAGAGAKLLPTHERCAACHDEVKQKESCGMCHAQPERPPARAHVERGLRFAHVVHAQKRECTGCHGPVASSQNAGDDLIPDMAVCVSCHNHRQDFATLRCTSCHVRPVGGSAPVTELYAHTGDWKRRHQDVARGKAEVCATCHDQTFCADCHEQTAPAVPSTIFAERPDRAQFHRGWYLDRHAVDARVDPAACLRCHGRTSCDSCHLETGVSGIARGAVSPHPVGWTVPGSPGFHGPVARRSLAECAACHDQGPASNCVSCHRVGGSGGSPHGPGFSSSLDKNQARVCLVCHSP